VSDSAQQFRDAQDAFARGDFEAAFDRATRTIAANSAHAQAHALRANAALKLERWRDAIIDLTWLLERQPDHVGIRRNLSTCWMRVGNRHKDKHELPAAESAYRTALAIDASNHHAHFNFGMFALETQHVQESIHHLRIAAQANPGDARITLKLAEAQIASGDNTSAIELLQDIARRGGSSEELQQCGRLLLDASSTDAAMAIALRLLETGSDVSDWAREFCRQLRKNSLLAESRQLLGELRARTDNDEKRLRIDIAAALGLPNTYTGKSELQKVRADYGARLDELTRTYPPERVARIAPNPEALLWDNFLLAYQGENDCELQGKFGTWLSASLQALLPQFAQANQPGARAKPRLAMVSSRFHKCTVGSYFTSWVEFLAQAGWELLLVHVGDTRDALTLRLANAAQGEIALSGNLENAARALQALEADIIVYPEIGMDLRTIGLAALRLAPVQVSAWGHPDTTGLPTIDAYLSCAEMEPANAAEHYTETLLALPGLGTRYLSHPVPDPVPRMQIGLPETGTLYLVPQSLFKLHPDNDSVYVDIARRDPTAVFVLFDTRESGAREVFDARIARTFAAAGIGSAKRWLFLPPRERADYLRVNMACDVMVDTLHFSGGNTSLDALHAGLPIVTCPGALMRGRQSMAMLRHLGVHELIVDSPQRLAELAVEVAHDPARRDALGKRIHSGLPELAGSDAPLHALDAHLKSFFAKH
jgi:tetratricopeptide (TPR) repeat protein